MNAKQRVVVIVTLLILLVLCLFPPWLGMVASDSGHGFVFRSTRNKALIDAGQFLVECVAVVAIAGLVFLSVGGSPPKRISARTKYSESEAGK